MDLFVFILIGTEITLSMSVFMAVFLSFISLRILNIFTLRSFQMVLIVSFCLEWVNFSLVDFVANCGVNFMYLEFCFKSLSESHYPFHITLLCLAIL